MLSFDQSGLRTACYDQIRSFFSESLSEAIADTFSSTSDDGDISIKSFHYKLSLSQWGFVNYISNKKHANLVFYVIRYSLDVIIMHSGFTL